MAQTKTLFLLLARLAGGEGLEVETSPRRVLFRVDFLIFSFHFFLAAGVSSFVPSYGGQANVDRSV